MSQAAALQALTGSQAGVEAMRQIFQQRRDLLVELLRAISGVEVVSPAGSFYAFPKIATYLRGSIKTSVELCAYLLDREALAVVPGLAFGAEGYVRLSFACSEAQIREGCARLRRALLALA